MTLEGQRRLVGVSLFISLVFLWGSFEAQPVFVDALLGAFGWSHTQVSWIASVSSLGIGIVGPIAGWLLDRYDARYVMGAGAILVGIGTLASALSNNYVSLVAATAVYGIGLGASTVLPASLVIANWHGHKRGTALGVTLAGMEVGGMLLTIACGWLIANSSWRAGYLLITAPVLLIAAPLLFINIRTRPTAAVAAHSAVLTGHSLQEAVQTRAYWTLMVVQTGSGLLIGAIFPFLVAYFHALGYSLQLAALLVTASYGFVIIGKPLLGMLGDAIGSKNAIAVGFLCWGLTSVGLVLDGHYLSPALFLASIGFALPAAIAGVPAVLAQTFGLKRFGSIYGSLAVGNTLGLFSGPIITGMLVDHNGSYAKSFEFCLPLALVCTIAGFLSYLPPRQGAVRVAAE
jgi:MFS family permease